jgi:hypothetical protein
VQKEMAKAFWARSDMVSKLSCVITSVWNIADCD